MNWPHVFLKLEELVSGIFVELLIDFEVVEPPAELESDRGDEETQGRS